MFYIKYLTMHTLHTDAGAICQFLYGSVYVQETIHSLKLVYWLIVFLYIHTNHTITKAPVPQRLRPRPDLTATDFDCDLYNHCNCFFHYWYGRRLVAVQSPISLLPITNRLAIVKHLPAISQRLIGDWLPTGWILFYHQILRK